LSGCGGVTSVSQDKSKALVIKPQETKSVSFREAIAGRKIRVLATSYTYDFLPIGKYRTLIMTREDWFPYVNANIQREEKTPLP